MWVFDATPLIYLAKVDQLTLISHLDESCVIPQRVYTEVVDTGIEQGYPDARRIERSVEDDVFSVISVDNGEFFSRVQRNPNLSDADVAILACAFAHDGVAVMDETYGRDVASTEGITTRGTAYLVLYLASQNVINVEKARTVIDTMVEKGWYCSPSMYAKIVQKLDSFSG
jgi:predicted nucleic acid-binding protein